MIEKRHIYLDNSATTEISSEALQKYTEVSQVCYGNPSSLHSLGLAAEKELNAARAALLSTLGARESSLVFTASGSEANNLAILGRALAKERYKNGAKIIISAGEHASVTAPTELLKSMGFTVAQIPTTNGKLDTGALIRELTPDVILVSIMLVNNETGALYDARAVSELIRSRARDAVFHVDATQGYMKVKFTKQSIGADMITLSSHKIEGPKGVGALVIDNKIIKNHGISPIVLGGGQELGLRSGTENVPAAAAFAVAAEVAFKEQTKRIERLHELRGYLLNRLAEIPEISPTLPEVFAPHIINITLPSIKSETMLHYLSSLGIYVSSGSACSSNSAAHVSSALTAYGRSRDEADSSVRISLSHRTTEQELDALCEGLVSGISRLARKR